MAKEALHVADGGAACKQMSGAGVTKQVRAQFHLEPGPLTMELQALLNLDCADAIAIARQKGGALSQARRERRPDVLQLDGERICGATHEGHGAVFKTLAASLES